MYEWLVLAHIIGVLGFMFTHGVAATMALRLRHERNPDRIRVMLQVSSSSLSVFYVSMVLLLGGGIWAGFNGHGWGEGWSRAIASSLIVQKLWMKNVVPNRNTAIASADRSAQIPAMTPIPPRMIITPLTRTAGPANGILLAAA